MKYKYLSWFRRQESQVFNKILPQYRGYELLLLGHDQLSPVESSPIKHIFSIVSQGQPAVATVAEYKNLPIPNHFVDVVVAWHVFDTHPHPDDIFAELKRVQRHDGVLIMVGVNRFPLAATSITHIQQYQFIDGGINNLSTLKFAAYELGFNIKWFQAFAGVRAGEKQAFKQVLDRLVCRSFPWAALGYCAVFENTTMSLTPVVEPWQKT